AEILAHLRVGIVDAVLVVLRSDVGERVRLVAMALEIAGGDLAEYAGKSCRGVAIFRKIGGLEKVLADLRSGGRRHLLDADNQHDARRLGFDRTDALVNGSRTCRTRVLDAYRRLEAEAVVSLQDEAGCEFL